MRSALLHYFGNCTYLVPQSPGVYCGLQGRNAFRPGEQPLYRDCSYTSGAVCASVLCMHVRIAS